MRRLLWWLLRGSRGGKTRVKIIETLKETPCNSNQLAHLMNVSWGTIKHHLRLLLSHGIIISEGDSYGKTYFLSSAIIEKYALFEDIIGTEKLKTRRIEDSSL